MYNYKLCSSKSVPGDNKLKEHKEFNESPQQTKGLTVFRTKMVIEETVLHALPFSSRIVVYKKNAMTNIKEFA